MTHITGELLFSMVISQRLIGINPGVYWSVCMPTRRYCGVVSAILMRFYEQMNRKRMILEVRDKWRGLETQ